MDIPDADRIRYRQIPFTELHQVTDQAQQAARFLDDVPGILRAEPLQPRLLSVNYDLLVISFQEIEEALQEIGLHLSNNLLMRIKRALCYYTEDTIRANLGCPRGDSNCTKRVFAKRYKDLEHGCRDHRPEHWRRYL
jgi:hypothetical protein